MIRNIIKVSDAIEAQEQENSLLVKVGSAEKKFELLSNEQCEEWKEESKKVGKALCFIKRSGKIYGAVVPKSTYVDEELCHKCSKNCSSMCEYILDVVKDDNVWKYPFISQAVEIVGGKAALGQLVVISCSQYKSFREKKQMTAQEKEGKISLMRDLFAEMNSSKSIAMPKGKSK